MPAQKLAIASLSSSHFDANPFSVVSDDVSDFSAFPAEPACRSDSVSAVIMEICQPIESGSFE